MGKSFSSLLSSRFWIIVGLSILLSFSYSLVQPKRLTVRFFDVGQGDSALVILPNGQTMMIDGGPDNSVLRGLGESLPFYRRRIDFLIYSHFHDDHITGLIEVINRYKVGQIIYAPSEFTSITLDSFWQSARENNVSKRAIKGEAKIIFSQDCQADFLNPDSIEVPKDQNNSLLLYLDCAGKSFLFTGDNSATVENKLLDFNWPIRADVLKVSHHGSISASTQAFLKRVAPRLALISDGLGNSFGHPNQVILSRLQFIGAAVWRTDTKGSLKLSWPVR